MNEQIMRILPAKIGLEFNALYPDESRYVRHGYNQAIDECATAIEKANLVRCPTEKEILDCISAVCQCSSCVTCRESAKALLALLRGAEMSERLSERERIRAILLNKTPLEAADWHLAEVKRIIDNKESVLTIHILRNWDREKIETFAKHLLGDNAQGGE